MPAIYDLPALPGGTLSSIQRTQTDIVLQVRCDAFSARCPYCQTPSTHVHGHYTRRPRDLPWAEWPTRLNLQVRRFRCLNPECLHTTFAEPLTDLRPHAQRTNRLAGLQAALGFAVGAQAASRLLATFHMPTSPDTVLRGMKRQTAPKRPTPRVLGVDDWALRKGVRYGTILVDLEQHCVVDVLNGRDADGLRAWLTAHPGVEIITRDRATDYSRAATDAAPKAQQVADRWHLLCNLSAVVREWVLRERAHLMPVIAEIKEQSVAGLHTTPADPAGALSRRRTRREQYREVLLLDQQGNSSKRIAKETGVPYATVRWWLTKGDGGPDRRGPLTTEQRLYIEQRWRAGASSAAEVHRELLAMGYSGSIGPIRLQWYHLDLEQGLQERTVPPRPRARRKDFNVTALTRLLVTPHDQLGPTDTHFVHQLCDRNADLKTLYGLVQPFRAMFVHVGEDNATRLTTWLERASRAAVPEMRQLARSVQRDLNAVLAGLTSSWSNAQTEGQVTKLKLIKRRHYGRASFELLRRSVLLA